MSVLSCRAVLDDVLTGDGRNPSVRLSSVCCSVVCPALTICRPADGCPVPFCPVLFGSERCRQPSLDGHSRGIKTPRLGQVLAQYKQTGLGRS